MFDLTQTRRAPTWLVVLVIASAYPWSWFVNQWFAANGYYRPLLVASDGLLYPNLQVGLPTVILWLVVMRMAGLRLADLGWRRQDLLAGVLATLAVWLVVHAVAACLNDLALDKAVAEQPTHVAGQLIGQLFGNALYEETVYRGFCLVQFLLIFRARQFGPTASAGLAAVLAAVVFALPHIPNRILKARYETFGDVLGDQTMLLCSGLFLAWVYMRTRNLWWAIGLHSLANHPTLLIEWDSKDGSKGTIALLGLFVTIAWPWVFVRRTAPES